MNATRSGDWADLTSSSISIGDIISNAKQRYGRGPDLDRGWPPVCTTPATRGRPEFGGADRGSTPDRGGSDSRHHRPPAECLVGGGELDGDREPAGGGGVDTTHRATRRSAQQEARPARCARRRPRRLTTRRHDFVARDTDLRARAARRLVLAVSDLRRTPSRRTP